MSQVWPNHVHSTEELVRWDLSEFRPLKVTPTITNPQSSMQPSEPSKRMFVALESKWSMGHMHERWKRHLPKALDWNSLHIKVEIRASYSTSNVVLNRKIKEADQETAVQCTSCCLFLYLNPYVCTVFTFTSIFWVCGRLTIILRRKAETFCRTFWVES